MVSAARASWKVPHPVPVQVDDRAVFESISPRKDVDGVTRASFATMALGTVGHTSCTPGGVVRLLDAYGVELAGRHAVVVGRSPILGLPVGMLLLRRHATVTYCHSHTTDLADQVARADVVVAAVGGSRWAPPSSTPGTTPATSGTSSTGSRPSGLR